MTLKRLQLYAVLGLLLLVALLEAGRYASAPFFASTRGRLLVDGVVVLGALLFFGVLFRFVSRLQEFLARQNRELLTLHAAAQDVHRVADLDDLLQRVVDEARDLVGARFGALSVIDAAGTITAFHTSGLSEEERRRIDDLPQGRGLLGVVLREGQVLRLADLRRDARSAGFPVHHPDMGSLLAVPVSCRGPFRGNLYLTEKTAAPEFSTGDLETLLRFATQVGIAIDNHLLHRQLRDLAVAEERARIARELHDGTAQVLAYVNTKAQAVREYLRTGRLEEATAQLDQLAAAARSVYTEVRSGIVGLREAAGQERTLSEALSGVLRNWQEETSVETELTLRGEPRLPPTEEWQLLRIANEALANVRKHACAQHVRVALESGAESVRLEIEDDGVGFDLAAPPPAELPRFGLMTMRERAESMGGRLTIDSRPGGPTRVVAEISLHDSAHRSKGAAS